MQGWTYLAAAIAVVFAIGWYLTYTAARLDRLHARVEGSMAALDAQLVRRAETALELGNASLLDPASSFLLSTAAGAALAEAESALITEDVQTDGISRDRAAVESELTDALDAVMSAYHPDEEVDAELIRRLRDACDRVELARRFHNEAVVDVRRIRRKPTVKFFRLAGHTQLPNPVTFDSHVDALNS